MSSTTTLENSHAKLIRTVRKILMILLALAGIGLILWLDSFFLQHADMPTLRRDMSYGLLILVGFLTSLLSVNLTPKLLKASGVIVIVLGAIMFNRGLAVAGSGTDFNTLVARASQYLSPASSVSPSCDPDQTIRMDVLRSGYSPHQFTLLKGVPVRWVIDVKQMNECNKSIVVPDYDLKIVLHEGPQTIEFTPKDTGVVPWSCWMGMIPGTFIVVDDVPEPLKPGIADKLSAWFQPMKVQLVAWATQWRQRLEMP